MQESIVNKPTVIIIAGPTAVGKTSVGISVAQHFSTEIISADSRQCFKELKIGVARPTEEELKAVPHHFIASHSINDSITAADFESYALGKTAEICKSNQVALMVGGTGLYIKAFTSGLDEIPEVPQEIRVEITKQYYEQGLSWLQEETLKWDEQFFREGENQNPRRLMRALEVKKATGRSILDFRTGAEKDRPFNFIKIGLELPREQLYRNINHRVDQMMAQGLLDEVNHLLPFRHLNALQTVGYKELFDHLEGKISLDQAVELIKQNTRRYAKRQMTWFKKDPGYCWSPPDSNLVMGIIEEELKKNN